MDDLAREHRHVLFSDFLFTPGDAEPHPDLDVGELALQLSLLRVLPEPLWKGRAPTSAAAEPAAACLAYPAVDLRSGRDSRCDGVEGQQ